MWGYFRVTPFFSIVKYMSPDGFSGIQILPNSIAAGGAYDAPPDLIVGWGGGHPSLFPPVSTLSVFFVEQNLVGISAVVLVVLVVLRSVAA